MTIWEKLKQRAANLEKIPDIDREILDYLKAINLFPWVMTGVSCAGHPEEERKDRIGATTSPYVQLFFEDIDEGANFLVKIYKQGVPVLVWISSFRSFSSRVGEIVVCGHPSKQELPEQRETFFTNIITALRKVSNERQD